MTEQLTQDYGVLDTAFLMRELRARRWIIVRFIITMALLSLVFTLKPHYPSITATLRVDPPSNIGGMATLHNIDTEIGSIRSFSMVKAALKRADYFALVTPADITVKPRKERLASDKPGALQFDQLYFPPAMQEHEWIIEITGDDRYELQTKTGQIITSARVGETITGYAESSHRHERSGTYRIEMTSTQALPGSRFNVQPLATDTLAKQILRQLEVTKRNSGPGSNLIDIELSLPDVTLANAVVGYLAENYILESVNRQSSAQQLAIAKLEKSLQQLKAKMEDGKQALLDFYARTQSAEPQLQARQLLSQKSELENELKEAEIKLSQLELIYTNRHPAIIAVREKIELLQTRRAELKDDITRLPMQQSTLDHLKRELAISTDLYQTAIKELARVQLATNSMPQNVHLIDTPRVKNQNRTKYVLQLMIFGGTLGLIGALTLIFLSASLRAGQLHTLSQLASLTFLPVNQAVLQLRGGEPDAPSLERLSQLAHYCYHKAGQQWIALFSPGPDSDSAHLTLRFAAALGEEKRVLLIDAHLFASTLMPLLGGQGKPGLSEALAGRSRLGDVIQPTWFSGVSYLPTGKELLNYDLLRELPALKDALRANAYDVILLYLPAPSALPDLAALTRHFDRIIHWLKIGTPLQIIRHYLQPFEQPDLPAQGLFVYDAVQRTSKTTKRRKAHRPKRMHTSKPKPGHASPQPGSSPKRIFVA